MWYQDIPGLLMAALGGGSLTGLLTWRFTKKKQNNDFITDLQNSISLLSEQYTKVLNELTTLRRENTDLTIKVDQTNSEIANVRIENAHLLEMVSHLKKENAGLMGKLNELNKLFKTKAE